MRSLFFTALASFPLLACGGGGDDASHVSAIANDEAANNEAAHGLPVVSRNVDSSTGRALFVEKGCVICHSVNGVGGKAGPVLDAQIGASAIDPLDFAARMWRGAPAMIELQSVELGYTVYLTADEIAHLSAFASDREEQKILQLEDLPENLRGGLLDEQFWEVENWDDFLRAGQEGEGEPTQEN